MQTQWRIVCGCTTGAAALMAWWGARTGFRNESPLYLALYWGGFLFLLCVTFLLVLVDIRYIRLRYALEKRELFRQTLGEEGFRKALLAAAKDKPTGNTEDR